MQIAASTRESARYLLRGVPSRKDPGYKALRRGRASAPGQIYCLTTVTAGRRPVFTDIWSARVVINVMRDLNDQGHVTSLAYVLMPDHLHWLVELGALSLAKVMQLMKTRSARRIRRNLSVGGHVWQAGFHDRAARREDIVVALARNIVLNPVRAGLVGAIGDYAFWDCVWLDPD